jgi:hypothetical protein
MANPCKYCDDIEMKTTEVKQELSAKAARDRLAARGGKISEIMDKIDSGTKLTDDDLDTLWQPAYRTDAIALGDKVQGKGVLTRVMDIALASKDDAKLISTKTEMADEIAKCIKKGVCGEGESTIAAAGAVAAAAVMTAMAVSGEELPPATANINMSMVEPIGPVELRR